MGRLFSEITFWVHLLALRPWRVLKMMSTFWLAHCPRPMIRVSWLSNQHQFESFLITKKSYKVYFLTPYTYHYNVICKLWIKHFITIYSFSDFELPATISPFNMFYRFQKKKKKRIARYVLYSRLERVDPFFRKLNRNPHGSKLTETVTSFVTNLEY